MPMFQDDLERGDAFEDVPASQPIPIESPSQALHRKCSEESIRTELCEGILPDSPKPTTPENNGSELISDRAELIERLKRGESPTWVPNRRKLESLLFLKSPPSSNTSPRPLNGSPTLLPAPNITPEKKQDVALDDEARLREGLEIERPRSALHSGDFREQEPARESRRTPEKRSPYDEEEEAQPETPWTFATSPPRNFAPFQRRSTPFESRVVERRSGPPSVSSSLSSSFAYKPPTSPLVQSESNEDLDLSLPVDSIELSESGSRNVPRRHTLTAHSSSYGFSTPIIPTQRSFHRRQGSFQAHQPQRSLTTTSSFHLGSPQTPALLRPRRPSFSSDISPIQHASMVGSYEESILRGRMSTTPSKPLDFLAQIGVLGIGKCKSSLRCPPHVTLPFPAVFYSYSNTPHGRSSQEDGPSPYVGQVDLENGLPDPDAEQRLKRKVTSRRVELKARGNDNVNMSDVMREVAAEGSDIEMRRSQQRSKRRPGSPRCPPGGSYRIPEKGQIQIIIKNQNKTAVKLFLVPYDLSDMEPGTKTFIRQRSYSAGPIIESVPESGNDRPILRYLVHLHICCPSRGRYYLYKSIRVVFANRVPDGKEKLRNEVTHPEPRFSPYKPVRVMNPPLSGIGGTAPASALAMEKAFRRRSSGFSLGDNHFGRPSRSLQNDFAMGDMAGPSAPVEPIPFKLPNSIAARDDSSGTSDATTVRLMSPPSAEVGRANLSPSAFARWASPESKIQSWDKLSKGDVGYGGNAFFSQGLNGSPGAEGLLSKRLRGLEMQQHQDRDGVNRHDQALNGGQQNP